MKYKFTLLLLLLSSFWLSAKEYSFEISPVNEAYRFVVDYNSSTKEFSLTARQDNKAEVMLLLMLGMVTPLETEDEPIYSKISGVTLALSTANNPWKGKAGELLFLDKKGNVLFGVYVDSEKIESSDNRMSYVIVRENSGLEKWNCYAVSPYTYAPYEELYEIARSKSSSSLQEQHQAKTIKDFITDVFGCFDVKAFSKESFSNIENALSSTFNSKVSVLANTKDYCFLDVDNPSIVINGRRTSSIGFTRNNGRTLKLSYSYTFKFDGASGAEDFARSLRSEIKQQCSFSLDAAKKNGKEYCHYRGTYKYNGIEYTVRIFASENQYGGFYTCLSIDIFL